MKSTIDPYNNNPLKSIYSDILYRFVDFCEMRLVFDHDINFACTKVTMYGIFFLAPLSVIFKGGPSYVLQWQATNSLTTSSPYEGRAVVTGWGQGGKTNPPSPLILIRAKPILI